MTIRFSDEKSNLVQLFDHLIIKWNPFYCLEYLRD